MIKSDGTILFAHVRSLPIQLRRVMELKKFPRKRFVGNFGRVKRHFHRFRVSGSPAAHLLVRGVLGVSAGVARYRINDAGYREKRRFHTPETPCGKSCFLYHATIVALRAFYFVEQFLDDQEKETLPCLAVRSRARLTIHKIL